MTLVQRRAVEMLGPPDRGGAARWSSWFLLYICVGGLLMWKPAFSADAPHLSETQVKAAFTFRFLSYVEWPPARVAADDTQFVIGVIGSDDILEVESHIAEGRKLGSHPIIVKKLGADDPLSSVHVLYVTGVTNQDMNALLTRARSNSVLVVTDEEDGFGRGAEIALTTIDGKVRFMVDLDAAARSNLRLGSGMLSVAAKVIGTP